MSLAALYAREARAELLRAWRTPSFVVPTLALPLAFYALFAVALSPPGSGTAGYALATYGVFAGLGPALYGFGAGVAEDRQAGLLALKQLSPLPGGAFLLARLVTALGFTLACLVGLYALAAVGGGVELPRPAWATLFAVHLLSVPPFCLLGLSVGLRLQASAAQAVTNLLFMGLAVVGGLWMPVGFFPEWMQGLARALPSFHLAELALLASGRDRPGPASLHVGVLLVTTVALGLAAARAWRRGSP